MSQLVKITRVEGRPIPLRGNDIDTDRIIPEAIVSIAQALAIAVVAEGVETPQQRDYLLGLGCSLQQGYLLGRPMPAQQMLELMGEAEAEAVA